jgi:hypothetical protein
MLRILYGFFVLVLLPTLSLAATPVDKLPEVKNLVDPFTFNDGSRVMATADWRKRRDEIKELLAENEYGHLPPAPEEMEVNVGEPTPFGDNGAKELPVELTLRQDDRELVLNLRVVLPAGSDKVPVLIQPTFFNRRNRPVNQEFANRFPDPAQQVVDRGYAYAEFLATEVAADNKEQASNGGIYELFGKDIDCGGLMAWAWGFHRVIDALEEVERIDTDKVVITGHSRYGKAALVAGAFDDRIAVTAPSHSGCGGAAPYRFIYGKSEQLHNVVGNFPYWFRPGFDQFVDHVDRLPVDQHLLLAAVAPRALLSTEGTEDYWINPEGSQLTYLAAKEVYKFLGADDKISIHFREVGHIPNNGDVLDFADHVFFDKPLDQQFGKLPYPVAKNGYSWKAPTE